MGRFRFAKTGYRELTVDMCDAGRVNAAIKEYQPSDEDLLVEFALRSWAPVFASLKEVLGEELSRVYTVAKVAGEGTRRLPSAGPSLTHRCGRGSPMSKPLSWGSCRRG